MMFISIFLMTLISINWGQNALFATFGGLLFILICIKDINLNPKWYILYFLLGISSVVTLTKFGDIKITNMLGFILSLLPFILFKNINRERLDDINKAIITVIKIHLILFYIQFFSYYVLSVNISYLDLLGLESRNFDGSRAIGSVKIMRASGLFEEPSTYFATMFLLSIPVIKIISGRFVFLIAVSGLISFSTFAFLFSLLMIVLSFNRFSYYLRVALIILGSLIIPLVAKYQYDRLFNINTNDYDAVSTRTSFLVAISERGVLENIIGQGVGSITFNENSNADVGGLFFIIYIFGILGLPMIYLMIRNVRFSLLSLGMLFLKVPIYYPLFWFSVWIVSMLMIDKDEIKK
ncbi:hypothetical protein FXE80_02490 [Vibrio cholerae]|uniref:hypothetical protein n=1 Tax=Vibrio cholerae TaxID=666 RepID=UPI0011D5DCD3|nr:hypothetical protein [Vibrio cholerae]TXY76713.1 hypothetical protein FXE80_02490 [Vibrio cholerae]GIB17862.1 hypothetical protein VCSRO90_3095 [Vibrio cholerae]